MTSLSSPIPNYVSDKPNFLLFGRDMLVRTELSQSPLGLREALNTLDKLTVLLDTLSVFPKMSLDFCLFLLVGIQRYSRGLYLYLATTAKKMKQLFRQLQTKPQRLTKTNQAWWLHKYTVSLSTFPSILAFLSHKSHLGAVKPNNSLITHTPSKFPQHFIKCSYGTLYPSNFLWHKQSHPIPLQYHNVRNYRTKLYTPPRFQLTDFFNKVKGKRP